MVADKINRWHHISQAFTQLFRNTRVCRNKFKNKEEADQHHEN